MTNFFHSGMVYNLYDTFIAKTERWLLSKKIQSIGGCDSEIVRARILQKIVALTVSPYVLLNCDSIRNERTLFSSEKVMLDLNGLKLNTQSGALRLGLKLYARLMAEFSYEWLAIMKANIFGFFDREKISRPVALVFGVPNEVFSDGNADKFQDFCLQGPIVPLNKAKVLVVQTMSLGGSSKQFHFVKRPVPYLLEKASLRVGDRFLLLLKNLLSPLQLVFFLIRNPLLATVARDLALLPTIKMLGNKKLISDIIITNSNYTDQYLWMRNSSAYGFKVHKVHYSQNNRQLVYKIDQLFSYNPIFRHLKVDEHWVWTQGYADYLLALGHKGPVHVVGPIMFYLPELHNKQRNEVFSILVFDITPVLDHVAEKMGIVGNYYSADNVFKFTSQLVSLSAQLEIEYNVKVKLMLKHKRNFHKNHDVKYIEFCRQLAEKNKIEMRDYNENIFSLISESDVVVSIPYTSPAYIAADLKVPSIYFDCTSELFPSYEKAEGLLMAENVEDLKSLLKYQIEKKMSDHDRF